MFSAFGIFAVSFLDSRCGLIGNVIVESIATIGATPRVSVAPLIRILGIAVREWRQQPGFDGTAFAAGLFRLAHRAWFAIVSLPGALVYWFGVRKVLQTSALAVERMWSWICAVGCQLREGSPPGLRSVICRTCFGPRFDPQECCVG